MPTATAIFQRADPAYTGLRMTAEEFVRLPDDGCRYELVDGVVLVSPRPTPKHQTVLLEIACQLANHLEDHDDVGMALHDTDVCLGKGPARGDLVYRPDLVFVAKSHLDRIREKIFGAPDVVVEVISPGSARFDTETKKDDYERCGVFEYWLIDPEQQAMVFYRLKEGRYAEVKPSGEGFASEAVCGFTLDLARVRKKFKRW